VAGGKHVPEGKSKLSCKCTTTDLELKIRMVYKCESGKSLSAIACELVFVESTVNTSMKDAACIKEPVKGMYMMKSAIIIKKCEGAISEMEKLLTLWMEAQMQKHFPLSLIMIQAKARSN
jgi:hypothetical protein